MQRFWARVTHAAPMMSETGPEWKTGDIPDVLQTFQQPALLQHWRPLQHGGLVSREAQKASCIPLPNLGSHLAVRFSSIFLALCPKRCGACFRIQVVQRVTIRDRGTCLASSMSTVQSFGKAFTCSWVETTATQACRWLLLGRRDEMRLFLFL